MQVLMYAIQYGVYFNVLDAYARENNIVRLTLMFSGHRAQLPQPHNV
jgi:hypothetical protein